ncbi:MAG: amino acid ABC transporter permease [Hyphomicrobiales bacterium]|nr:amino acid ABC transporter permease [Hyphomicrobiales bacterium]
MTPAAFLRTHSEPVRPPPAGQTGFVHLVRERLFGSLPAAIFTLLAAGALAWAIPELVRFLFIDAVWSAPNGDACRAPGAGACWAYIWRKLPYFTFGSYPEDQRWRVWLTMAMGAILIFWLLRRSLPGRNAAAALFFIVYPIVAFVLLSGAPALGLPNVPTDLWGGAMVSLVVAVTGIVLSLPGGILLALGRRSKMPVISALSTGFIEFVRGVPFITVLFMANMMLPLFVPEAWAPDRLLRPLIGVVLFSAAYMAEVVRGGLQALPKGQSEAGQALGLRYWQRVRLILLPQALALVIPGIVNTFIALFKDTTLVAVVGIFDFLRTVDTARLDPEWAGPNISATGYIFAALFYFVFCFGMSRYSLGVEKELSRGKTH